MQELIIKKVEEWATKDEGFHVLQCMDQNNNEFEFRNEDYDKSLVEEEKIAPSPAISAEFPGLDLGIETPGEVNPPMIQNDGYGDIQQQAMVAARNAEYDPNEITYVEDEEDLEEQDDMTLGTIEPQVMGDEEINKPRQTHDINNILPVEMRHGQEQNMIEEELEENENIIDMRS